MTKVEYKPLSMQGSLLEEFSSPFFNGVKGERRVGLQATGMAKETLPKAVQTSELAHFCYTPFAKVVIR